MDRPLQNIEQMVSDTLEPIQALLLQFKQQGEIRLVFDVLTMKNVFTIRIPFPKNEA